MAIKERIYSRIEQVKKQNNPEAFKEQKFKELLDDSKALSKFLVDDLKIEINKEIERVVTQGKY
jgi:hypothetical protein